MRIEITLGITIVVAGMCDAVVQRIVDYKLSLILESFLLVIIIEQPP